MNNLKSTLKCLALFGIIAGTLAGCAGSQMRVRKAERDKVSQSSRLYCDFVNGDLFPDVEVQLNIEMAKRCDHGAPLSITQYRTSNENMGVIYCCSIVSATAPIVVEPPSRTRSSSPKVESKAATPAPTTTGDGLGD